MLLKALAVIAYLALVVGLVMRKRRRIHVGFMVTGITVDFCIVIFLELTRNVTGLALTEAQEPLEYAHIISSTIAFLLYLPVVSLGVLRLRNIGPKRLRSWHIRLGITAFIFRTLGVLFMFSIA